MRIRFSAVGEFKRELARDGPPTRIVRLTRSYRPTSMPPIRTVELVAAYVNGRGELVELRQYLGDVFGSDLDGGHNQRVAEYGDGLLEALEVDCRELGLEVRSGLFKEDVEP